MLTILKSLFTLNPKVVLVVLLSTFLAGNVSGGWLVHKFWSGAEARKEVAALQRVIKARDEAAKQNADLLKRHQDELETLKRRAQDVTDDTPNGACLTPADVNRLRSLWNDARPRRDSR